MKNKIRIIISLSDYNNITNFLRYWLTDDTDECDPNTVNKLIIYEK